MQCYLMAEAKIGMLKESSKITFFIHRTLNFVWIFLIQGAFCASKQGKSPGIDEVCTSFEGNLQTKT